MLAYAYKPLISTGSFLLKIKSLSDDLMYILTLSYPAKRLSLFGLQPPRGGYVPFDVGCHVRFAVLENRIYQIIYLYILAPIHIYMCDNIYYIYIYITAIYIMHNST